MKYSIQLHVKGGPYPYWSLRSHADTLFAVVVHCDSERTHLDARTGKAFVEGEAVLGDHSRRVGSQNNLVYDRIIIR